MTFSAEKSLRDIAVLLAGSGADGMSSSEHALETIRSAISKAKGATSVPLVTDTGLTNRLLPDVDLVGERAALLAPTAAAWQAGTGYTVQLLADGSTLGGVFVRPATPTGTTFQAYSRIGGTTGSVEPTWPTDGSGPTDPDGDLVYASSSTPGLDAWPGAAQAVAGANLVAGGLLWSTSDSGNTGGSLPVFTGHAINDTVTDGDLTWTALYHVTTWAALTRVVLAPDESDNTSQPFVRPSVPNGFTYQTSFAGTSASSSDTEPDWGSISPGDAVYVADGDVLWQESTGNEASVITGIRAPSGPSLLTLAYAIPSDAQVNQSVTLADDVSGYDPAAAPAAGDALFYTDGLVLSPGTPTARLFHSGAADGRWTYLGA